MLAKELVACGAKHRCGIRRMTIGRRAERGIVLGDSPPPMGKTQRIRRDAHEDAIAR
jgi:hypothetical protein